MSYQLRITIEALLLQHITNPMIVEGISRQILLNVDVFLRQETLAKIALLTHEEILKMGYVKKDGINLDNNDNSTAVS